MAVDEILLECVNGKCNNKIALELDFPADYIESVLKEFLNFSGWKDDIDFSPYMVYNSFDGAWNYYKETVKSISAMTTTKEIGDTHRLCRRYNNIRKEIFKYVK